MCDWKPRCRHGLRFSLPLPGHPEKCPIVLGAVLGLCACVKVAAAVVKECLRTGDGEVELLVARESEKAKKGRKHSLHHAGRGRHGNSILALFSINDRPGEIHKKNIAGGREHHVTPKPEKWLMNFKVIRKHPGLLRRYSLRTGTRVICKLRNVAN